MELPEFIGFPKIARLSRECVITEKIDGTNGQIYITEDLNLFAGSRTRWLTLEQDNFGFYAWCQEHKKELLKLGPGRHFGEWWGKGIQRGYGLNERRFSLFNTLRWLPHDNPGIPDEKQQRAPACCHVVPILRRGLFNDITVAMIGGRLRELERFGSVAAPGFMKPEGIVLFHVAANMAFKKTIEDDDSPKSA